MKNIQIIDAGQNCTFSPFQATDGEFALFFPEPRQDIKYSDDITQITEYAAICVVLSRIWERAVRKQDAHGIRGTIFISCNYTSAGIPGSVRMLSSGGRSTRRSVVCSAARKSLSWT